MALQIARNSRRFPTQSLKPMGLPSDSSRSWATNSMSPLGVEKDGWEAGEITSAPIGTCRMWAISSVIFAAGRIPPLPGFAPCESLISMSLTLGWRDLVRNRSGSKLPSSVRQPK